MMTAYEMGFCDQSEYESSLTSEEFTYEISKNNIILDKLGCGIVLGDERLIEYGRTILVQTFIMDYEMQAFCHFCEELVKKEGYVLVLNLKRTNEREIGEALCKRGWLVTSKGEKHGNMKLNFYNCKYEDVSA